MGLPARQRRVLESIETRLRCSDPQLASMFMMFDRLTRDEEMPRIEELRHRAAIMFLRIRLALAPVGRWLRGRIGPRQQAALFFPVALVLVAMSVALVVKFGGTTRCTAVSTVAAAKPHPHSKPVSKGRVCPPALMSPLLIGR